MGMFSDLAIQKQTGEDVGKNVKLIEKMWNNNLLNIKQDIEEVVGEIWFSYLENGAIKLTIHREDMCYELFPKIQGNFVFVSTIKFFEEDDEEKIVDERKLFDIRKFNFEKHKKEDALKHIFNSIIREFLKEIVGV